MQVLININKTVIEYIEDVQLKKIKKLCNCPICGKECLPIWK